MLAYVRRRLLQAVPVLIGISMISFAVVRLAPGDPAPRLVNVTNLTPEQQQEIRVQLGLVLATSMIASLTRYTRSGML